MNSDNIIWAAVLLAICGTVILVVVVLRDTVIKARESDAKIAEQYGQSMRHVCTQLAELVSELSKRIDGGRDA